MGIIVDAPPVMTAEHGTLSPFWGPDALSNDSYSLADVDQSLYSNLYENDSLGITDLDKQYQDRLTHYLTGIGGSTVCCLGTIANALSIAVLTRRAMRSSTYLYLTALAICDSLVLFFTLLLVLKDTRPPGSSAQRDYFHDILFPYVHPTAFMFQTTSIWLTLAFTVDRYIMICHPFKAERMCRRSRARKVVIGLYIAGFIFNFPRYLEYHTTTYTVPLENSSEVYTFHVLDNTDIGKNEIFRKVMHSWLYLICVWGVPFLMLIVLNGFLIRAVHLSRIKGKEINAREKHRNDTTIMLIGVIVIFLICQGPALVSRMIYAFKPGSIYNNSIFTLNEVGNFLVTLNSAINIVPYYLFGRKFRSEFWRLFCTCLFDRDELQRIVRSYSVSMDHRRMSQYNVMEMNGMAQRNGNYNGIGNDSDRASVRSINFKNHNNSYQNNGPSVNTASVHILNSETNESVAIPLIHNACNSISSNGQGVRDASKDSLKDDQSRLLSPSQPLSYQSPLNGNMQYMTVTTGPSIKEPEWSAV